MIVVTLKDRTKVRTKNPLMAVGDKFKFTNEDTKQFDFVFIEDIVNIVEEKE